MRLILNVILIFLTFYSLPVKAQTIIVCNTCEVASIIEAIAVAKDYDTIRIKKGTYNHELDINSPDEVPAWVDDMDMLFDRADEAFLYNDRNLAAQVYELLLDALHIAEDIAVEHQLYSAQDSYHLCSIV